MTTPPFAAMADQAIRAYEEQRRIFSTQNTAEAVQRVYWEDNSRRKRQAPTPVASSTATPVEPHSEQPSTTPHQDATLVLPWAMQDSVAAQATASHLGVDINDEAAMQGWLARPVRTNQDVLTLMRSYHEKVIRPEMFNMVVQLETALKTIGDSVYATRRELEWMGSENRLMQKHQSGVQLVTSGWPTGLAPEQRMYQLCWMLSQCPKIVTFLQDRAYNTDHSANLMVFLNVLAVEPTTDPQQAGFYSTMTLLTFKSWQTRSAFLERFGGSDGTPLYTSETTPQPGHHIRVSPSSPQWQRKLESPLRVIIAAINDHPEHQDASLIILWKTLTLMAPVNKADRKFKPDAAASARLYYHEVGGEFRGRLELTPRSSSTSSRPLR